VVSIKDSWFQVSPLLRLIEKADSSLGTSVLIHGTHQLMPVVMNPEPVPAYASDPFGFQATTAEPIPVKLLLQPPWFAAPVGGLREGIEQEPAQVQGVSINTVGTAALHGYPNNNPASSLPDA
jgi:hypothetical protein